jgi:hypothetical protein
VLLQSQDLSPQFVKNLNILSVALVHNYLYNFTSLIAVMCTVMCEAVMVDTKVITVFRNMTRYTLVHLYRLFRGARVTIIFIRVNDHLFTLMTIYLP